MLADGEHHFEAEALVLLHVFKTQGPPLELAADLLTGTLDTFVAVIHTLAVIRAVGFVDIVEIYPIDGACLFRCALFRQVACD